MDLYGLGNIFRQVLEKGGLKVALGVLFLLILVGACFAAVAWCAKKGFELGQTWLAQQERERTALIGELQGSRNQINTFLGNHLTHLKQEREEHTAQIERRDTALENTVLAIQGIQTIQTELLDQAKSHREEDSAAHTKASETLARIEGHLG